VPNVPARQPVSDELLESVICRLKRQKPTPKMLGVQRGKHPAEIIFLTCEGKVPCQVKEDDMFVFFEMPSGENDFCARKSDFLEELSSA
jgi:hypothetical protein